MTNTNIQNIEAVNTMNSISTINMKIAKTKSSLFSYRRNPEDIFFAKYELGELVSERKSLVEKLESFGTSFSEMKAIKAKKFPHTSWNTLANILKA